LEPNPGAFAPLGAHPGPRATRLGWGGENPLWYDLSFEPGSVLNLCCIFTHNKAD